MQEREILDFWEKNKVFEKSISERPEGDDYVFYDGPPFATGLPHYGHLLQSVTKDVVPRYFTMKGHRVERKWGWDCHGLPIEAIVEKEMGLKNREDIEALGVRAFNEACDAKIGTYVAEWKRSIRRLGRWVDMENAYQTKDLSFMESVWWVFKTLYEKGLIYEGYKVMHVSPALETVLSSSEVSSCYFDVTDLTATVSFPLLDGPHAGASLLAWTTTPWTLPGNALLAVGEGIVYVKVSHEEKDYILAKERLAEVFKNKAHEIKEEFKGADLVGTHYEPLFPYFKDHANAFRVASGDFVTTEDGTGVVHIAPGFGEDDLALGVKENVAPIMHVKMDGRFVPAVEEALVAEGYDVKDWPVKNATDSQHNDIEIVKWLAHHGRLFSKEKLKHSYPHCWRTDVPLINYATTSWFVKVSDLREQLLKTNSEIHWVPEHVKEGRFGKWLEGAKDWSISRSRYWGNPLPIWKAEDGETICIGSVAELKELSGVEVHDLHKQFVDEITFEKNGKTFRRIPEVLDCWFESGSMPYAQLHYPFENKEVFDRGFPAEFIAEAQDQTRGWFYVLHVLSNALFEMPAFKNIVVTGLIMAEDGKKMSKRLKNYPDPSEVVEKYGADALRYYLMASPVVHMENLNFKESDVAEVKKKFLTILENVLAFYELYKEGDDVEAPTGAHVLDAWILSRLNSVLKDMTSSMDRYEIQEAVRPLQGFVTDFSTWYVRRSRDRMKVEGADKVEALRTMRTVLLTLSKMMAPVMPFMAEELYQRLNANYAGGDETLSVHLEEWPEAGEVNEALLAEMGEARAIVSRILDEREKAGRAVKQALGSVAITTPSGEISPDLLAVILDEVNIKSATVAKGELATTVDFTMTPQLIREGMARELTRKVNGMRKDAGLTIADRIDLVISGDDEVKVMISEHGESLKQGTLAESLAFEDTVNGESVRISEHDITLKITKR